MTFIFFACGSRSSDFSTNTDIKNNISNPLPPCPDSPNCVRITRHLEQPVEQVFERSVKALREMHADTLNLSEKKARMQAVFDVLFFRDDMVIQLKQNKNRANKKITYVYIRSSSRTGYSDLGVNRRRVKKFLDLLQAE